jgi:hypothetical protein
MPAREYREFGYDDGRVVPAIEFVYPEASGELSEDDAVRLRRESIIRLLGFLCHRGTPRKIGVRVLLLAHLLGTGDCRTQRELAARLRISPGRVSQALKALRREFKRLART